MLEKELLNSIYEEFLEIIGEKKLLEFYVSYRGMTLNIPKRLYSHKKIQTKFAYMKDKGQLSSREDIKRMARKYDYSERQIFRLINDVEYKILN